MEYWIVYRAGDGVELARGCSPDVGAAARQVLAPNQATMVVPGEATQTIPTDMGIVKAALQQRINAEAEQHRQQFITPGAGQMLVYLAKVREAEAVSVNAKASTPLLSAEAAALGKTVPALAADVLAANARWTRASAAIEVARLSAKAAVSAASDFAALNAASTVDWANATATGE
ncbi:MULTISPECIES: hypothetical protein [unclassified Novosphingobium]|uniref:hypothetical protein n=1 Tax=unclassified Novosphingobium TaxID=2644732 RepID=UPI000D322594|nr:MULTISPECIES: hypothetical protein [unclassified Novosphingobium]PTR08672.1 hypothetical protein C8K11_111118 [Novosphingobium sp. GV055]PUB01395.1 hypothetical protein C8K12_111118 [Novosphingobium sp. GV061]PUB16969.1 hypothetical protein C8K14_111118 [Novosphingobium sp. GV079]PUB39992.1 hypothetical protein C8K10_111118 [Novosphingobium sp. GV027]